MRPACVFMGMCVHVCVHAWEVSDTSIAHIVDRHAYTFIDGRRLALFVCVRALSFLSFPACTPPVRCVVWCGGAGWWSRPGQQDERADGRPYGASQSAMQTRRHATRGLRAGGGA